MSCEERSRVSFVRRARRRKEYSSSSDRNAVGTAFRFPFPFFPTLIAISAGSLHKRQSVQEQMVIVNCDQDHRPEDLKPLEAAMASSEPDTPGVTASTMLATTDSPNENTNATKSSTRAVL